MLSNLNEIRFLDHWTCTEVAGWRWFFSPFRVDHSIVLFSHDYITTKSTKQKHHRVSMENRSSSQATVSTSSHSQGYCLRHDVHWSSLSRVCYNKSRGHLISVDLDLHLTGQIFAGQINWTMLLYLQFLAHQSAGSGPHLSLLAAATTMATT